MNHHTFTRVSFIVGLLLCIQLSSAMPGNADTPASKQSKHTDKISVDSIMDNVETRYDGDGFSALFYQESPLPDIQLTDSAAGKAYFRRPGKFRWEYETPDVLHYISDGSTLWIHSPIDNQAWIGNASVFFGKGSSATFLTDIKLIRKRFHVSLAESENDTRWRLKLTPREDSLGISRVFISINKSNYNVIKIVSFNNNGEETRIMFSDLKFDAVPDHSIFNFNVPETANIIPLE